LHELDAKVLTDLDRLKESLTEIANVYSSIAEHYDNLRARVMTELFGTLGEAHKKLADTCNQLKDVYNTNNGYLKRYREELIVKNELFKEWKGSYIKFQNTLRRMQEKGSELLKKTPLDQLRISSTCPYTKEELEMNKPLAFLYIECPELEELEASKDMYGFYTNRIGEEFNQLWADAQKDFVRHFGNASKTNADIFNKVDVV